ncbi:hypothetical protein J437_LFUL013309 [Ladona fulva]|uniref:Phospholipase A2 n=1 Tax=Ladona fulva TaxID=123851 RepID=A0A8K0P3V9_LADFU|nr:hypothetical protein J437_LFUL013309 [Ladona fulva]
MYPAVAIYLSALLGCVEIVTCLGVRAHDKEDMGYFEENLEKFEKYLTNSENMIKEIGSELESNVELRAIGENPTLSIDVYQDMNVMYPGTKWCGPGNRANGPNDLGLFRNADSCCRQHDQCPDFISPGETKYGLTNTGRFSRLLCSCEQALYNCLKSVNTIVAKQVGVTYYNLIRTQCFKLDFPIINCAQYSGRFLDRCLVYNQDTTQPKIWQWFDEPVF